MRKTIRLGEAEETIAEMDLSFVDDDIAETDENTQMIISGWYVYLPEFNLKLHEGIVGIWDEEMKGYMPDFAVTVVCEGDSDNTGSRSEAYVVNESGESTQADFPADLLYYEQDGFVSTMANWLNGRLSIGNIEQLKCEIILPEKAESEENYEVFNQSE